MGIFRRVLQLETHDLWDTFVQDNAVGVITHPCPNFKGALIKPPLELGMDE